MCNRVFIDRQRHVSIAQHDLTRDTNIDERLESGEVAQSLVGVQVWEFQQGSGGTPDRRVGTNPLVLFTFNFTRAAGSESDSSSTNEEQQVLANNATAASQAGLGASGNPIDHKSQAPQAPSPLKRPLEAPDDTITFPSGRDISSRFAKRQKTSAETHVEIPEGQNLPRERLSSERIDDCTRHGNTVSAAKQARRFDRNTEVSGILIKPPEYGIVADTDLTDHERSPLIDEFGKIVLVNEARTEEDCETPVDAYVAHKIRGQILNVSQRPKTQGRISWDFCCSVCEQWKTMGHRREHYLKQHQQDAPKPEEPLRLHIPGPVSEVEAERQRQLLAPTLRHVKRENYPEFQCYKCKGWRFCQFRDRHYQSHDLVPPYPVTEPLRGYRDQLPLRADDVKFQRGGNHVPSPRPRSQNVSGEVGGVGESRHGMLNRSTAASTAVSTSTLNLAPLLRIDSTVEASAGNIMDDMSASMPASIARRASICSEISLEELESELNRISPSTNRSNYSIRHSQPIPRSDPNRYATTSSYVDSSTEIHLTASNRDTEQQSRQESGDVGAVVKPNESEDAQTMQVCD